MGFHSQFIIHLNGILAIVVELESIGHIKQMKLWIATFEPQLHGRKI